MTGQFATAQGKIMVNDFSIQIGNVVNGQIDDAPSTSATALSELDFARTALIGAGDPKTQHSAFYGGRHGISGYDRRATADCQHHDCITQALDAGSTGAATVAAYCTYMLAAPCAGAATGLSTVLGAGGTLWTAYNMINGGDADLADVAVAGSTTYLGAKFHPYIGPFVSAYQWWLDSR